MTGSSRGLGWAIAEAVVDAGDELVATARRPDALRELAERGGERVATAELDVTRPEQARAAVALAVERFGSLDVVVNNAGYGVVGAAEVLSDDELRRQVEVNLWGVVHVTRAALPVMRGQRSGHLIQISSTNGRYGEGGLSAYCLTKFAIEGFSEAVAEEVAPLGVKVTLVEPGAFRTEWAGPDSMEHAAAEPLPEYDGVAGAMLRSLLEEAGAEPGDPAKAAQAVVRIAAESVPPLRLVLSAHAVDSIRAADRARAAELDRWEKLSRTVDFDDAG